MSWFGVFDRRKRDLDEELRSHLAMDIRDRMQRGEPEVEARAAALRELGNLALIRDVTQGFWSWSRLENWLRDGKYALRGLTRSRGSRGFALAVVGTLALGTGAALAMFTVVDRVLLRSLPYAQADRLVEIWESGSRGKIQYGAPYFDVDQWRQRSRALSDIGFYVDTYRLRVSFLEGAAGSSDQSSASRVTAAPVSANLFGLLGVAPQLGRGFAPLDAGGSAKPEEVHSIVLSDAVWRGNFGADPGILGKLVSLSGERYTVIGVMPRGFTFPREDAGADAPPMVWEPVILGPDDAKHGHNEAPPYQVVGRLREGATVAEAEAELRTIQAQVVNARTDVDDREFANSIAIENYRQSLVESDVRRALLALFGASGMLWLIACVNVTSLMLARATARQREIAVRGALGASRWQIIRQLLMEGLILSGSAAVAGLALAWGMLHVFARALADQFGVHESLALNLPLAAGVAGLTLLSALVSSVWPAVAASRASIETALRQGSPSQGMGRTQHRTRSALVVTQIALSLALLAGCGLLLRTIYALRHVNLGFQTDHVLVANMIIPAYQFAGRNMNTELYQPMLERVKALPGVESATLLTEVPLGKTFQMIFTFNVDGKSADAVRRRQLEAQFRAVGPETQRVFGFKMLRGRFFNEQDTATSQAVVVVNRAFARWFFGDDRDPGQILGKQLVSYGMHRDSVVVGVLADVHQFAVAEPSKPEIEVDLRQITPESMFYQAVESRMMDLAVRTREDPEVVIPELRAAMKGFSSSLAESNFTTMDQVAEDSFGSQMLAARLLEIFAGSALLLSVAGIYALLAYLVVQRTRELGLRIALGAQRGQVMRLILRQAVWMLAAGLAIGAALAFFGSRALRSFLYGVDSNDPWTLGAVMALLLVCGLAAAWLPARRASRVDPMEALRAE
jgi:predicted permease